MLQAKYWQNANANTKKGKEISTKNILLIIGTIIGKMIFESLIV